MSIKTRAVTTYNFRGQGIPRKQREIVDRLRKRIFDLQRRFEMAERSALIFEEMLDDHDNSLANAINKTYEANAFLSLRLQLFRILIIDLYAGVLDKSPKGSVLSILKELKNKSKLEALREYYSDPTGINVTLNDTDGLDNESLKQEKAWRIDLYRQNQIKEFEELWKKIEDEYNHCASCKKDCGILQCNCAERIKWARDKLIAHYDVKSDDRLFEFDDDPKVGDKKFSWREPIEFLKIVRPLVYDVVLLITNADMNDPRSLNNGRFYAKRFWDRFKNGKTELKPDLR